MTRKGIIISTDDSGRIHAQEIDLPIDTNMHVLAWSLDFWRKINEHSKFRKKIIRAALGRYAFRELIGLWSALEDWRPDIGYGLEDVSYQKDKVDWP